MSNPLFNLLGNSRFGNMQGLVSQFENFRKNFTGDPRQQVQQLLNSGQVSQDQYNQAVQIANALQKMIK